MEQRWTGNLVGSDIVTLDDVTVTVFDILSHPQKFDGKTGPDPIEPDYRNGAQVCKVYLNRPTGKPMIYSQAHGGLHYRLWFDVHSALKYLRSKNQDDAMASVKSVLQTTKAYDRAEVEFLLRSVARIVGTTKPALVAEYLEVLTTNKCTVSAIAAGHFELPHNNDLAHKAAIKLISQEVSIETDASQTWRYNGKHFEPCADRYLTSELRKIHSEPGWLRESGLSKVVSESLTALKDQTYTKKPMVAGQPGKILNLLNGELHFLKDGTEEFREHNPSSGLTTVLSVNYASEADAPMFRQMLEELFWPPARERMKSRSVIEQKNMKQSIRRKREGCAITLRNC